MSGVDIVVIGANDGVSNMPDDKFLIEQVQQKGKSALLVEPYSPSFEKLKANYGDFNVVFERAAITLHDGTTNLYVPVESDHEFIKNNFLCSVSESFARDASYCYKAPRFETVQVPCMTFASLMSKHGITDIWTLLIDAEGYDAEIILSIDFSAIKVDRLIFESASTDGHGARGPNFEKCVYRLRKSGFTRFIPSDQFGFSTIAEKP